MSNRKDFLWISRDGEGTLAEQLDRVIHDNQWSNMVRSRHPPVNPHARNIAIHSLTEALRSMPPPPPPNTTIPSCNSSTPSA